MDAVLQRVRAANHAAIAEQVALDVIGQLTADQPQFFEGSDGARMLVLEALLHAAGDAAHEDHIHAPSRLGQALRSVSLPAPSSLPFLPRVLGALAHQCGFADPATGKWRAEARYMLESLITVADQPVAEFVTAQLRDDPARGDMLLHVAASGGTVPLDALKVLTECGVNPLHRDNHMRTPSQLARQRWLRADGHKDGEGNCTSTFGVPFNPLQLIKHLEALETEARAMAAATYAAADEMRRRSTQARLSSKLAHGTSLLALMAPLPISMIKERERRARAKREEQKLLDALHGGDAPPLEPIP